MAKNNPKLTAKTVAVVYSFLCHVEYALLFILTRVEYALFVLSIHNLKTGTLLHFNNII